jgi:hypothetical protein
VHAESGKGTYSPPFSVNEYSKHNSITNYQNIKGSGEKNMISRANRHQFFYKKN